MPHSKSSEMRTDLAREAVADISDDLLLLLWDVFSLFLKTKNFHWHVTGPHFREYHLMLDEQADQIFAMTDVIAERARNMGASTVGERSSSHRRSRLPQPPGPVKKRTFTRAQKRVWFRFGSPPWIKCITAII
jgi:starvation-inducible DNA-binding protein